MPRSPSTTWLAIAAAACFAARHPLSKPLLEPLHAVDPSTLTLLVTCLASAIGLAGLPILFALGRGGRDFWSLVRDTRSWPRLALVAALGIGSVAIYAYGLSRTHAVYTSLMLNTSPLWAALWARTMAATPLPRVFFSTVALALAAIVVPVVATTLGGWDGLSDGSVDPPTRDGKTWGGGFSWSSPILLLVPGLFTLRTVLVERWFRTRDPLEASATVSLFTFLLLLPATVLTVVNGELGRLVTDVPLRHCGEFVIGTLFGATLGTALYIKALRSAGGDYGYVTAYNLLIPSLSALIGWALALVEPIDGLAPDTGTVIGIAVLFGVLVRFRMRNAHHHAPRIP
jgi:drug/metabolite transporter (DMT)-like permease